MQYISMAGVTRGCLFLVRLCVELVIICWLGIQRSTHGIPFKLVYFRSRMMCLDVTGIAADWY